MYDEQDLESLANYLMETARDIERKQEETGTHTPGAMPLPTLADKEEVDVVHQMRKLARQIEVIGYNPLIFEDILAEYDIHCGPLDEPLEEMPLHINDESPVTVAVVKWRLSQGK